MQLIVISVLFGLSLVAAWVLFKLLKSTATVSKPEYQLGGAAAGFVVILTLLSITYIQVDDNNKQDIITNLNNRVEGLNKKLTEMKKDNTAGDTCLNDQSTWITYSGTVTPPVREANVVLGLGETTLQQDGGFAIKTNVKPSQDPFLYVIGAGSHAPYKQVFPTDDVQQLKIPH